jgi:chromatin segregation and condensation protein Rec8/ScpA/Scc1 (kleisin family)
LGKADFETLFFALDNRIQAIVTFLALLELLNAQELAITQGDGYNNFWLSVPALEEEAANSEDTPIDP